MLDARLRDEDDDDDDDDDDDGPPPTARFTRSRICQRHRSTPSQEPSRTMFETSLLDPSSIFCCCC